MISKFINLLISIIRDIIIDKEWLTYLQGKDIVTSLLRNHYYKEELKQCFSLFGKETGLKLGINKAETVEKMMNAHKTNLIKMWYDKTGGKFIPDYVVMQNFNIEEADKFLVSSSNWSNLMRIKDFSKIPESREAMLKLAYTFGAFDQDQRGFKKLQELLTNLPRTIDANNESVMIDLNTIEERIQFSKDRNLTITDELDIERGVTNGR